MGWRVNVEETDPMKIVVKTDPTAGVEIVSADGKPLEGSCIRCAKCCQEISCPLLEMESWRGKTVGRCTIYNRRPWWCAVWPKPGDDIPDGCGYRYG